MRLELVQLFLKDFNARVIHNINFFWLLRFRLDDRCWKGKDR